MSTQLSLKSMLVPSKTNVVEYPGMPGFEVTINFLSREILQSIRKKSTKTTFKNRQPVEELNDDLFLDLYVQNSIKGWKGLKMSYLEQLAPVEVSADQANTELEYTQDNALALMKASTSFDSFISEQVTDLGNFSTNKQS
jgi:hypothetical protein